MDYTLFFNYTEKDQADFEADSISKRLKEEYLEEKGKLRKVIASTYSGHSTPHILRCKDHKDSITTLCLASDGAVLYSGSKDGSIVKCNIEN